MFSKCTTGWRLGVRRLEFPQARAGVLGPAFAEAGALGGRERVAVRNHARIPNCARGLALSPRRSLVIEVRMVLKA